MRYYITYKGKIIAGPMPKEDADFKLIKLQNCFLNLYLVPETEAVKQTDSEDCSFTAAAGQSQ